MSTVQQTSASATATAAPSPAAAATEAPSGGFQQQLATAQVAQGDAGALPQQADPSTPPLPPPPPPPPPIPGDAPVAEAPSGGLAPGSTVQNVSEPADSDSDFSGDSTATAEATNGAQATAGEGLLASLGLSPALQRIIRHARQFVPANASLHIFSTAPGAFRGKFVVPKEGVVNAVPSAPAPFVAPPRVVTGDGPAPAVDDPQPPPPPSAPPAPDGSTLPPPPAPPPIPPDEIVLPEDDAPATDAPTDATDTTDGDSPPDPQLVTTALSAYRSASAGAAAPLRIPRPRTPEDD